MKRVYLKALSFQAPGGGAGKNESPCRSPKGLFDVKVEPGFIPCSEPEGDTTMRFMILLKANKNTESGTLPDEQLLTDMGKYNEELVKAGVLLAGEGLQPSSKGARIRFSGSKRTVIDGPFSETKELIAGFWIFQVKSREEAIEWVKRCPNPTGEEAEIEIRQVFEAEDFAPSDPTGELMKKEAELRALSESRRG
jgi:hypothetical protein